LRPSRLQPLQKNTGLSVLAHSRNTHDEHAGQTTPNKSTV
jgi:hypothetical protein